MPSSYAMAEAEVRELCQELITAFHPDMDSADVKVDLLMAFRDPEGEEPALSKDKNRILGLSKTIGLKDRVKGMGDCEVILDGDAWQSLTLKEKSALLDHQLEHFEVKRDKDGSFVFDDINRPVLKIRPHDRVMRFFDTVASRHREHSIEADQLRSMFMRQHQTYLPFVPAGEDCPKESDQA